MLATSRIKKGDRLLRIPENVLITPETAIAHSQIGSDLEAADLPAWTLLAATLAESRFADQSTEWRPYAQALPQSTGCVLEWEQEEVNASFNGPF